MDSLAEFTAGAHTRRPRADELKAVASDYVLLGDFADADKWFTEVIVEKPDDAEAWYLLGRTKYNENAFTAAVTSFGALPDATGQRTLKRRTISAWPGRGWTARTTPGWLTKPRSNGREPRPLTLSHSLNLGTMLAEGLDFDRAIQNLLKAAVLSPDNPKVHEELGRVYEAQQNLPKAQAELERAVALAPKASALHFQAGTGLPP